MTAVRLDTHVVVWLYTGDLGRLSPVVRELLDRSPLAISPMVELELTFLNEIGRLTVQAERVVADLRERLGLGTSSTTFAAAVTAARGLDWTRDPFDRLIAGDAVAAAATLVTKDARIREHLRDAVW